MCQIKGLLEAPFKSLGLSARTPHLQPLLAGSSGQAGFKPKWLELLVDNWLNTTYRESQMLEQLADEYTLVFHGVNLSLGGVSPLDKPYIQAIKTLAQRLQVRWYSEHLSFSGDDYFKTPDLLPMPYSSAAVNHCVDRIHLVQDILQAPLVIENISYYHHSHAAEEAAFFAEVIQKSSANILFDVNNLYVNSQNFNFSTDAYLEQINCQAIVQMHLAGHSVEIDEQGQQLLVDTHSKPVIPAVLALANQVLAQKPDIAVNLEWDKDIPSWPEMQSALEWLSSQLQRTQAPPTQARPPQVLSAHD